MTGKLHKLVREHRPTVLALAALLVCLAVAAGLWLAVVRGNTQKSLSQKISDDYTLMSAPIEAGQSVSQTFSYEEDLLAVAVVFGTNGEQPAGTLNVTLTDADTGEVLATSWGDMSLIVPGQYTGLGLDHPVPGKLGGHYCLTLTPDYTGAGRLCVGTSNGTALWDETYTFAGEAQDATLSLIVTYRTIGGFLDRFFIGVAVLAALLVFFGVRTALCRRMPLHRLVFVLVVAFGLLYSVVLPPYAAPDEKYHINQSFTLACRWANFFSDDEWRMGNVPIDMSYRREHDVNTLLQNENTTVFSWQELSENLFTTTTDSFDSHVELAEYQTDRNPTLYVVSAAAVFLGFVLHLGFVPVLMLGRLANLLAFAVLAALAVRFAPFGRRVFAAAALLPMTLHLAASFSRDALLLGLAFVFTSLCMQAVFADEGHPVTLPHLVGLGVAGVLLAPAKLVYLPLAALFLLIPNARLGARPWVKKGVYLAACCALALCLNSAMLTGLLHNGGTETGTAVSATTDAAAPAETTAADTAAAPAAHAAPEAADSTAATAEDSDAEDAGSPLKSYFDAIPAAYLEHSPEAFVRRVFYCGGLTQDVADSEVEFWAQALVDGDVSAAELGQSFFFSPSEMEQSSFTDEDFIRAVTLTYFGSQTVNDWSWDVLTEQGRVLLFKACYTVEVGVQELTECGVTIGMEDAEYYPLDREILVQRVEEARAVRESQSVASPEDLITYTPGYILTHLPATVLLVVRTAVYNTDDYIRGLVGGLLSYNSVELAWGWVIALYGLLAFAALPARRDTEFDRLPAGHYRAWCVGAVLACCARALAGCIVWTPTYYETVYGLQGRYLLPVLPLAMLVCAPRRVLAVDADTAASQLVCGLCAVNFGVLLNIMLVILAR